MSGGQIAGLIAAVAWAVLVLAIGLVIVRLTRVVDETKRLVAGITDQTVPLLGEVTTTVTHVNAELERVDSITANVQSMTGNVSALTSLFAATLGSPVVKVAAFTYGVRRAAGKRDRADVEKRIRAEMKGKKRARKAAG